MVSATSASSSLGSGSVDLNGGILSLTPNATATAGLSGTFFNVAAGTTSQRDYGAAPVATRIESSANSTWTAAAPPAVGVGTVNAANLENFGGLFTGKFFVAAAGPQTFALSSDDSTRLFIDGVPVVINEGGQGGTVMFTNTITLTAGYHDIRVQYNQGTGGANYRLYTPNGVSLNGLSTTDDVLLGNTLKVNATSTLDLVGSNFAATGFGLLQQTPGTTFNVTGEAGKQLRFNGAVAFGTGTMTINSAPDVTLGVTSMPGVTLIKQGVGRLVLDNTSTSANDFTGSTIEVQGGKVVAVASTVAGATNPLGTAAITLNGGGLFLDSKFNGGTFANTVNLTASATIESLPSVVTTILGSGANSLNLGANNLTVDTIAGGTGSTQAGITSASATPPARRCRSPARSRAADDHKNFDDAEHRECHPDKSQSRHRRLQLEQPQLQRQHRHRRHRERSAPSPQALETARPARHHQYAAGERQLRRHHQSHLSVALGASLNLRQQHDQLRRPFWQSADRPGTGTQVTLDVNNNGANTNSFIQMGALRWAAT